MPSKITNAKNKSSFGNMVFVNFKLDKSQRKAFDTFMQQPANELDILFVDFVSNGHKISVSFDETNDCWIGSATCKDEGNVNFDHCMTSRAKSWYEAMMMNVFKDNVLAKGTTWSDLQSDDTLG